MKTKELNIKILIISAFSIFLSSMYGNEEIIKKPNVYKILWMHTNSAENISEKNLDLLVDFGFFTRYKSWLESYKADFTLEQKQDLKRYVTKKQTYLIEKRNEFVTILSKNMTLAEQENTGADVVTSLDLFQIQKLIKEKKLDYYFIFSINSTEFDVRQKNLFRSMMLTFQYYAGKNNIKIDYCLSSAFPKHPTQVAFTYDSFGFDPRQKMATLEMQNQFYEKLVCRLLEAMGEDNKIVVIILKKSL